MELPSNIILVGFMGSGKTSTGKELSKMLNFHFLDTDAWIEDKTGMTIPQIFEKHGELFFRQQEEKVIKWLVGKNNYVVSTGGGTWVNKENRENLLKLGWCIWLKISPEDIWQRVSSHLEQRPLLLKSENPVKHLKIILKERMPFYSLAQASIDTNKKNPKEIALEILETLNKRPPFNSSN
jgi:shikimate kinase